MAGQDDPALSLDVAIELSSAGLALLMHSHALTPVKTENEMSDQINYGEPLLGREFISLLDAVENVACQIPMNDAYVDAHRDTSKDKVNGEAVAFLVMLNRWPVKMGFQQSEAAKIFLQQIFNAPVEQRPRWFDTVVGFAVVDDQVASEGKAELVRMVNWAENYKRWYSSQRWHGPATSQETEAQWAFEPIPRVRQIGFYRSELIRFLDRGEIKHCLGKPLDAVESTTSEPSSLAATPTDGLLSKQSPSFRDDMGRFIHELRCRLPEEQRENPAFVYSEMKRIASDSDIPKDEKFPLLGFSEGKGICWEKATAKKHSYLDLDALKKRMNPEKRGKAAK